VVFIIDEGEEGCADVAVLFGFHDPVNRGRVVEEDDVGVATLAILDQDPLQDAVLLADELLVKVVRGLQHHILGDSLLWPEWRDHDVHVYCSFHGVVNNAIG